MTLCTGYFTSFAIIDARICILIRTLRGQVVARLEQLNGWVKEFEWLAPSLKSR